MRIAADLADAVDSQDPCLVVDRAGGEQRAPCVTTVRRPVGNDDEEIGGHGRCAKKLREPEVVTDQRCHPHAAELDRMEALSGLVVVGLVGE